MMTPHHFGVVLSHVFVTRRITQPGGERNTKNLSAASWKYRRSAKALKPDRLGLTHLDVLPNTFVVVVGK